MAIGIVLPFNNLRPSGTNQRSVDSKERQARRIINRRKRRLPRRNQMKAGEETPTCIVYFLGVGGNDSAFRSPQSALHFIFSVLRNQIKNGSSARNENRIKTGWVRLKTGSWNGWPFVCRSHSARTNFRTASDRITNGIASAINVSFLQVDRKYRLPSRKPVVSSSVFQKRRLQIQVRKSIVIVFEGGLYPGGVKPGGTRRTGAGRIRIESLHSTRVPTARNIARAV